MTVDTQILVAKWEALRNYLSSMHLNDNDNVENFDREHLASLLTAYYDAEAAVNAAIAKERSDKAQQAALDAMQKAVEAEVSATENVAKINLKLNEQQAQIDGEVSNWFYPYTPTVLNEPASLWTATAEKNRHIGDTFSNTQPFAFDPANVNEWEQGGSYGSNLYPWEGQNKDRSLKRIRTPHMLRVKGTVKISVTNGTITAYYAATANGNLTGTTYWAKTLQLKETNHPYVALVVRIDDTTNTTPDEIATFGLVIEGELTHADAGKAWRWVLSGTTYTWTPIADSDAVKALQEAAKAQSAADGKSTTFVLTNSLKPEKYSDGDMWVLQNDTIHAPGKTGDVLFATTASEVYNAAHWVTKMRYTDDTAVNNLQVGGVNLFRYTKNPSEDISTWGSNLEASEWGKAGEFTAFKIEGQWGRLWQKMDYRKDQPYTFSCWVRRDPSIETSETIMSIWLNGTNIEIQSARLDNVELPAASTTGIGNIRISATAFQKLVFTFTPKTDLLNSYYIRLEFYTEDYQNKKPCGVVYGYKMEQGNKATAYSEAPEDLQKRIEKAQTAADAAKTAADAAKTTANAAKTAADAAKTEVDDYKFLKNVLSGNVISGSAATLTGLLGVTQTSVGADGKEIVKVVGGLTSGEYWNDQRVTKLPLLFSGATGLSDAFNARLVLTDGGSFRVRDASKAVTIYKGSISLQTLSPGTDVEIDNMLLTPRTYTATTGGATNSFSNVTDSLDNFNEPLYLDLFCVSTGNPWACSDEFALSPNASITVPTLNCSFMLNLGCTAKLIFDIWNVKTGVSQANALSKNITGTGVATSVSIPGTTFSQFPAGIYQMMARMSNMTGISSRCTVKLRNTPELQIRNTTSTVPMHLFGNGLLCSQDASHYAGMMKHGVVEARNGSYGLRIDSAGIAKWQGYNNRWDYSGVLSAGTIAANGIIFPQFGIVNCWGSKASDGNLKITHNLGHTNYTVTATPHGGPDWNKFHAVLMNKVANSFELRLVDSGTANSAVANNIDFMLYGVK